MELCLCSHYSPSWSARVQPILTEPHYIQALLQTFNTPTGICKTIVRALKFFSFSFSVPSSSLHHSPLLLLLPSSFFSSPPLFLPLPLILPPILLTSSFSTPSPPLLLLPSSFFSPPLLRLLLLLHLLLSVI